MKPPADFSEAEWAAYHAVQDALADGEAIDPDRLRELLGDSDDEIAAFVLELVESGLTEPEPEPEPAGPGERVYNAALYRIVHGLPGVTDSLAVVTGLTANVIKKRVAVAKHTYTQEELAGGGLSRQEVATLCKLYAKADDPGVRDWLASIHSPHRGRPDTRSSKHAGTAA